MWSRTGGTLWLVAAACSSSLFAACEPVLDVGSWMCAEREEVQPSSSAARPVAVPWSTGFEHDFCDYMDLGGFCIVSPMAHHATVSSPVHSGQHAAAFGVVSSDPDAQQSRCVRQGILPGEAYYGAWYFVPARANNAGNWNLLHFQGGDAPLQHGLWDVSIENGSNGELQLVVFDFMNSKVRNATTPKPIPIGAWFHVEFYLKRASDKSGRITLYQDDELLLDAANLITDDSAWGQWYVGNLATALTPAESTLYVDDVTIRDSR